MEEKKVRRELPEGVIFGGAGTSTKGLATSIYAMATKEKRDETKVIVIGSGANNQAAKAYCKAKGMLKERNIKATLELDMIDIPWTEHGKDKISGIQYTIKFIHNGRGE